jgi:hypothetical protein
VGFDLKAQSSKGAEAQSKKMDLLLSCEIKYQGNSVL